MDVTTFFTRLLQPPKQDKRIKEPDDINDFDSAWTSVKVSLLFDARPVLMLMDRKHSNSQMRDS